MTWLVKTVQDASGLPLCIDSANSEALTAGLAVHKGKPLINSISGDNTRYQNVLPLVKQYNACVVALCNDNRGLPSSKNSGYTIRNSVAAIGPRIHCDTRHLL